MTYPHFLMNLSINQTCFLLNKSPFKKNGDKMKILPKKGEKRRNTYPKRVKKGGIITIFII